MSHVTSRKGIGNIIIGSAPIISTLPSIPFYVVQITISSDALSSFESTRCYILIVSRLVCNLLGVESTESSSLPSESSGIFYNAEYTPPVSAVPHLRNLLRNAVSTAEIRGHNPRKFSFLLSTVLADLKKTSVFLKLLLNTD